MTPWLRGPQGVLILCNFVASGAPLPISYPWLSLFSNLASLTMHRLYVLFRPDHLIIWFGLKNTCFLICEKINNMALLKENKK